MIRRCSPAEFDEILAVVNDAAQAYRGIIPPDRWHVPYMPAEELHREIGSGVVFWGYEENIEDEPCPPTTQRNNPLSLPSPVNGRGSAQDLPSPASGGGTQGEGFVSFPNTFRQSTGNNMKLLGVMGIQDVQDVTLIRHAYVRTAHRNRGIGGLLLERLEVLTNRPVLMGTWKAATWAVAFYEKHGYRLVTEEEKDVLLRKYWDIPERQVETSCVLADERWRRRVRGSSPPGAGPSSPPGRT